MKVVKHYYFRVIKQLMVVSWDVQNNVATFLFAKQEEMRGEGERNRGET